MTWLDIPSNALAVGVGFVALLVVVIIVGAWLVGAFTINGEW